MSEELHEVVREAERIVWATGWRLQEQAVIGRLSGTVGLACARIEERSEVFQLVAYDGEHLGHVRRETSPGQQVQWVAVLKAGVHRVGNYPSAAAAAEAVATACGKSGTRIR
ncbi:MAG: hypothetical protein ACRDN0_19580 [Trebonia sp.]